MALALVCFLAVICSLLHQGLWIFFSFDVALSSGVFPWGGRHCLKADVYFSANHDVSTPKGKHLCDCVYPFILSVS